MTPAVPAEVVAPWAAIVGGLSPEGPSEVGADPADCAGCHPREASSWARSRHAVASSNPMFRASWDRAPDGWCLGCHEPLVAGQVALVGAPARPGAKRPAVGEGRGVDCAACHLADGAVWTGPDPSAAAAAAHPVRPTADLGSALCARCHEFPFQNHTPIAPFSLGDEPAQSTFSEWAGSDAAARGETCATCHLPRGAHRFDGAHRGDAWRGLLTVTLAPGDGPARVTLAGDLPHAVPTGDPFRRLELRLCADPACRSLAGTAELRRVFAPDATTWRLAADTTLPPSRGGPTVRQLEVPVTAPAVAWELWLLYGERRLEPLLPADEVGRRVDRGRF